jgi:uridine phosphorylase
MSIQPDGPQSAPILTNKHYDQPSVFSPDSLLREARRQKRLPDSSVLAVCVLDPDGDLVDYLHAAGRARPHASWACYHTTLATFLEGGIDVGVLGRVVGAPFAVLVAEELFACGCELLISITSAGQIMPMGQPPYVVLIEKALRDEGTSYHYLPPAAYSHLRPHLLGSIRDGWDHAHLPLLIGASWTTDAPFRETEAMLEYGRQCGILAVEMEAAALYALAEATSRDIVCFAHVTNQLGQRDGDFEKGEAAGSETLLRIIDQTAQHWRHGGARGRAR